MRILKVSLLVLLALIAVAASSVAYWKYRVDQIVDGSQLIIVGEGHGTIEPPAFVEQTMGRLLAAGRHVTLGLEIASDEQARIDQYLSSDGASSDYAALVGGDWWLHARSNAQATEAMAHLIEAARLHRR